MGQSLSLRLRPGGGLQLLEKESYFQDLLLEEESFGGIALVTSGPLPLMLLSLGEVSLNKLASSKYLVKSPADLCDISATGKASSIELEAAALVLALYGKEQESKETLQDDVKIILSASLFAGRMKMTRGLRASDDEYFGHILKERAIKETFSNALGNISRLLTEIKAP